MYKKLALLLCFSFAQAGCDRAQEFASDTDLEPHALNTAANSVSEFDVAFALNGDSAVRDGRAQNHCWDGECWEVVWCGHNICDGSWSWKDFPHTGQFSFTWKGVSEKCAGSPPYQLRINGEVVTSGRIAQWGSCSQCPDAAGNFNIFKDYDLGNHTVNKGDTITLWAETEFSCGINWAGAYAAHDNIVVSGTAYE